MHIKQVIVVRKDLNMRKGKIAAQAAHASTKVFFDRMTKLDGYRYVGGVNLNGESLVLNTTPEMMYWIENTFDKICVSVDSESGLDALYGAAVDVGIPCAMIVDCGKTEFNGVATKTCIAIGPDHAEKIDLITGGLPLL